MNPEIKVVRDSLVRNKNRAVIIEQLDAMMGAYKKAPSTFIMPSGYQEYSAAFYEFKDDQEGWFEFVKHIFSFLPKRSGESMRLQEVITILAARVDQIRRRERLHRAISAHEKIYGPFKSAAEKELFVKKMKHEWTEGRLAAINHARSIAKRMTGESKLSADDLAVVLQTYWDAVDAAIDNSFYEAA